MIDRRILHEKIKHRLTFSRGFTLVEIIAAALIISITTAGTFSAYLYARQFSNKFLYKTTATKHAQGIADYIRYGLSEGYGNPSDLVHNRTYNSGDVTDSVLAGLLDSSNWDMNNKVNQLNASYQVQNVCFNSAGREVAFDASQPHRAFKKIIVRIAWQEREAA
jgi:prepilin-type N-terminal cleavage/methylation domain-containing protein